MANFTVTNLLDLGAGSLRQAILDANSTSGADTIDFDSVLSGGIINLSSGQLSITDALSINGLGANLLTINAGKQGFRVFNIDDGTSSLIDVTLNGLTITGGQTDLGGGIFSRENLTLSNSTVRDNQADFGGGIDNFEGTLTVSNSTVSGNEASVLGGGIENFEGTLNLINSTVSGNTATNGGGINTIRGTLTANNSTLSDNEAILGGGLENFEGTVNLSNTIIANSVSGGDCVNRFDGVIATNINNLIKDGSCSPLLSGDPNLGPLQDNGGPTFTHALLSGSKAINAGNNAAVPSGVTTDQRGPGFLRLVDGQVDIGAFEVQSTPPPTVSEPSSLFGLLAIGVIAAGSWLRQRR
jgi:hypothetical protein